MLSWTPLFLIAGALIGGTLAGRNSYSTGGIILSAVVGAVLACAGASLWILGFSRGTGAGLGAFIQPNGEYEPQYSFEESLAARGDIPAAIGAYEKIAEAEPNNIEVRLRAAELARGAKDFRRAAALYRQAQGRAVNPADDVRASLRLIDLYLVWPESTGKALPELRRLMDRNPGTDVERRAKGLLEKLKSERFPVADELS